MNYNELLNNLQNLINKKVTQEDIGEILGCGKANISRKVRRKSEVTVADLLKIENHYNVELLPCRKSGFLMRKKPLTINFKKWGFNFEEIPAANKMTLSRMEAETGIEYDRLCDFVRSAQEPTLEELAILISNFDVTFEDLFCEPEEN